MTFVMRKKAVTLVELLIAIFIVTIAVGGMFLVYPTLFEGVKVNSGKVKGWEIARENIEILKNSNFDDLWTVSFDPDDPPFPPPETIFTETSCEFPSGCSLPADFKGSAVYYVEQMHGDTSVEFNPPDDILTDLIQVEVVVCFQAGRRIVGEDQNLNGILDSGEDTNADNKISSPVSLKTLITSQ